MNYCTKGCGSKIFPVVIFAFLLKLPVSAQLPAFPGAEGTGRHTSGGRGTSASNTVVFEVINLDDDNNPGSLRYALSQNVLYRTIVFRVSGTIHLNSKLTIRSNTTIAGQTAPGDGICIADHPVVISGDNVIVRYIRCRMGDKNQNLGMVDGSGGDDTFGNLGGKNLIIDHCSFSWSSDETLTIYRGDSVTIQWCFVTEPLNYSYHFETGDVDFEQHGYGGIWGSRNGSFHHNLIAHCKGRLPRFAGSSTYPPGTAGQENSDFRNNVIYNWISYSTNGGEGGNYNVVNNYYKYGPSTSTGNSAGIPVRSQIMNPSVSASLPYPKIYLAGNYVDGYSVVTTSNWRGIAMAGGSPADTILSKVTTPFSLLPITDQPAVDAYEHVLSFAGCRLPAKDTLDQRIVNDVRNRTGRVIDVQGGYPHGTPYAQTVNAWPFLSAGTPPVDTDHDGMPDLWESAHGLNSANAADRAGIAANGYTNLENYLNSIADNGMDIISAFTDFVQATGTPSNSQTYSFEARNLTGNVVITPPLGYQVSVNGGTSWSNTGTSVTINATNGTIPVTSILVRLNAVAIGNFSGNIVHSVNGTNISIPVNGLVSAATSTGDINQADSIRIFPNPATNKIIISYPRTTATGTIEVLSQDGKKMLVKKVERNSEQTDIETSRLAAGVYLLKYTMKKKTFTVKFVR